MITAPAGQPGDVAHSRRESVTRLLGDLRTGRREALDELFPLVYRELHELSHRQRATWNGNETLNTTALVHEAYVKLVDQRRASWESEAHFLAAAAKAIRHILINYARDRRAQKRGGGWQRVPLRALGTGEEPSSDGPMWDDRVLALDRALGRLADRSERQGRIVECLFFGGMTVQQAAYALDISTATVSRGWAAARAWLHRELRETS